MKSRHSYTWVASGILAGLALSGTGARADTVFLKSGAEIEGTVTVDDNNTVVIKQTNGVVRSIRKADVDTIVKSARVNVQAAPEPAPVQVIPAAPAAPAVPASPAVPAAPVVPAPGAPIVPVPAPVANPAAPAVPAPNGVAPAAPAVPGAPAAPAVPGAPAAPAVGPNGEPAPAAPPNPPGTVLAPAAPPAAPAAPEVGPDGQPIDPEKAKYEKEWKEWTPPPGLAMFPDHAKRMEPAKEVMFMQALDALASAGPGNTDGINKAKGDIAALGSDALPYVVAGTQHQNVDARSACMSLIPQMDGKRAVKQVIEVFYAAMPADGRCAWYQVQFIDKIRETLVALTGQTFINVQSKDALVQDGLRQYIDWYNQVYLTLPPQLGEKKVQQTDPEYGKKITELRKLKLVKRDWPSPPAPSDLQDPNNLGAQKGTPALNEATTQRQSDKDFAKDGFQKVGRDDAFKRPQDK